MHYAYVLCVCMYVLLCMLVRLKCMQGLNIYLKWPLKKPRVLEQRIYMFSGPVIFIASMRWLQKKSLHL